MAPRSSFPRSSAWDRPGFLLWHALLRFQRAAGSALAPLGLTQTQFRMLTSTAWLEENLDQPPSQRQLADHTGADAMMTSQVVRALEKADLLVRSQDPVDTRVKRVRCTPEGRRLARRAIEVIEQVDREFFGSGAELDDAVAVLRRLAGRDEQGVLVDPRWQREG